jgi:hypothetical protein
MSRTEVEETVPMQFTASHLINKGKFVVSLFLATKLDYLHAAMG